MRNAVVVTLLAVCSLSGAPAWQEPPAQSAPAQTPAAPKVDPKKMASPASRGKKPPVSVVDDTAFILGSEDQISCFVYQGPEFSGSHLVRPDGKITIPLVGDVQASGLTPEALARSIKEKIKTFLNDPDVTVSVLSVKSKKFFIQGEVNRPGEYTLLVPTKMLEALVNAGGFKDFANQKKITIIHTDNSRATFNYKDVIKGKHLEQNVWVQPGDIIVVK